MAKSKVTLEGLNATLQAHTAEDARRFEEMSGKLDSIGTDVKSLLESRSFSRGAWKAIVTAASAAGAAAGLLITYLRGH